ncbi:hypothetical protein RI367_000660 [Sorochytrium milnesiophthora]
MFCPPRTRKQRFRQYASADSDAAQPSRYDSGPDTSTLRRHSEVASAAQEDRNSDGDDDKTEDASSESPMASDTPSCPTLSMALLSSMYIRLRRNLSRFRSRRRRQRGSSKDADRLSALLAEAPLLGNVDEVLRAQEHSTTPPAGPAPLLRVDTNSLASNQPNEDASIAAYHDGMYIIGVADGHGGSACSAVVKSFLPSYIIDCLPYQDHRHAGQTFAGRRDAVCRGLRMAFETLDTDLMMLPDELFTGLGKGRLRSPYPKKVVRNALQPALNGCVASIAVIEACTFSQDLKGCHKLTTHAIQETTLYVANAGDARAILGRRQSDGTVACVELTNEHTCRNQAEMSYLIAQHPHEEATLCQVHPVAGGQRLLGGLMPTRAFGDAVYKWPTEWQRKILPHIRQHSSSSGPSDTTPHDYFTPPYLRATPEITCHELDEDDLFMVIATDGLFDELSNAEVIDLVRQYLYSQPAEPQSAEPASRSKQGSAADSGLNLADPFDLHWQVQETLKRNGSQRIPPPSPLLANATLSSPTGTRQSSSSATRAGTIADAAVAAAAAPLAHQWTLADDNLATHLIRNALGGANNDRVACLLSIPHPYSRDFRDDITVVVVLFDTLAVRAAKAAASPATPAATSSVSSTPRHRRPPPPPPPAVPSPPHSPLDIPGLERIERGKRFRAALPALS